MKFSGREDIDASPEQVFGRLTDFAAHERAVLRRGVRVQRVDGLQVPGPGMTWGARVRFRGRDRQLTVELMEMRDCEVLEYRVEGTSLTGGFVIDLLALSPRKTRMGVALEVRPKNLTGRLLMQSLRLLKPKLNRRFKSGFRDYARTLAGASAERR